MRLHFLNYYPAFVLAVVCQPTLLTCQSAGLSQEPSRIAAPFAEFSRHPAEPTALGRVDDGVNQTIELGIASQFDATHSASNSAGQLQSSLRRRGQQPPLSLGAPMAGTSAQRPIASGASARPSYLINARPLFRTARGGAVQSLNKQDSSVGKTSKVIGQMGVRGSYSGQADEAKRFGKQERSVAREHKNELLRRKLPGDVPSNFIEARGRDSFERLEDPFWAPSRASFEWFTIKALFDQPCGDSCGFRATMGAAPSRREPRNLEQLGAVPEARYPATIPSQVGRQLNPMEGINAGHPTKLY